MAPHVIQWIAPSRARQRCGRKPLWDGEEGRDASTALACVGVARSEHNLFPQRKESTDAASSNRACFTIEKSHSRSTERSQCCFAKASGARLASHLANR